MGLKEILQKKRVYFDANIFIYLLEGNTFLESALTKLRDLIAQDEISVISSELTYTEVLAYDALLGDNDAMEHVIGFIQQFEIHSIIRDITIHAGVLRGETKMKTPDALHVATAIQQNCDVFLTNDADIKTPHGMELVLIKDYIQK